MSLFSRLFGKSAPEPVDPVPHAGFLIFPEPAQQAGGFRIGARIEKEVGGEVKVHNMIRVDSYATLDTATEASVSKAKQLIDQQGDRIFT